ncbi:sialic acid-binding Ig-like lectin 12 [Mixophyes fleayi]|uniref:sialic acid-binding Ig-like lectin 12 n=1 Tax=Mixophyes fleayi TaxID=3061075 RepID=UPI003F4E00DA
MGVIKFLLLFFSVQGGTCCDPDSEYCTEQQGTITVEVGGSVTLPCTFSYPKKSDSSSEVKVYWREGKTSPCGNNPFIYNHTENQTHNDYSGRIFMVGNPKEQRTATIRIQNLRRSDGPMFCCRVEIRNNGKKEQWQNSHGTFIHFKDQVSVEHRNVVPAIMGEDIAIPCYVHNKSADTIQEVTWRIGTGDLCSEINIFSTWTNNNKSKHIERWSIVKFPKDLSLHVRNVTPSDSQRYCCEVKRKLRTAVSITTHLTEVLVEAEDTSQTTLIIASAVVLLLVIILCVIFIVLKKKGIICRKETGMKNYKAAGISPKLHSNSMNMNVPNVEHNDMLSGQEDSGGVVYAHLNVTSLQQGSANQNKKNNPESDSQVLYAAIRPNL